MIENSTILLTGGTGSFGQKFTELALTKNPKTIRIYSRGELLQKEMSEHFNDGRLRFFIGDVRDKDRLSRAMSGVDIVVHAAALKQVPQCEYNPLEAVNTNIMGSVNIIEAALSNNVSKVIAISSDKAVHSVNTYGKTKAVMESLITQANVYARNVTKFSCTRYGNVIGSRGSVVPVFLEQAKGGNITVTDLNMTRFWITLEQGVRFVIACLSMMRGGEIFVPKIPSMSITDLARAVAPDATTNVTGVRPGEKIHEVMVTEDEAHHTREFEDCFVIQPEFPFWTEDTYWDMTGETLPDGFRYTSQNNDNWLSISQLRELISGKDIYDRHKHIVRAIQNL